MEPIDMADQKCLNLCRREASLAAFWNAISNEVNCFVEGVHRSRSDGIEAMRFTSDRASGDRKYCDRR